MITPPSDEFLLMAAVVAVSTAYGVYMAARTRPEPRSETVDITTIDGGEAMPEQQLTFEDAWNKRDAVLAEVAENNTEWMAEALRAFEALPESWSGMGEDLRFALVAHGVSAPKTPHAWGSLVGTLVRRGALVPTGERRPMRDAKSNGRRSDVYVRTARGDAL